MAAFCFSGTVFIDTLKVLICNIAFFRYGSSDKLFGVVGLTETQDNICFLPEYCNPSVHRDTEIPPSQLHSPLQLAGAVDVDDVPSLRFCRVSPMDDMHRLINQWLEGCGAVDVKPTNEKGARDSYRLLYFKPNVFIRLSSQGAAWTLLQ